MSAPAEAIGTALVICVAPLAHFQLDLPQSVLDCEAPTARRQKWTLCIFMCLRMFHIAKDRALRQPVQSAPTRRRLGARGCCSTTALKQ